MGKAHLALNISQAPHLAMIVLSIPGDMEHGVLIFAKPAIKGFGIITWTLKSNSGQSLVAIPGLRRARKM